MESLAKILALWIVVATSLEHFTPRQTWSLCSPMVTNAWNLTHCLAQVFFCTDITFKTSFLSGIPRKKSVISDSLMSREMQLLYFRCCSVICFSLCLCSLSLSLPPTPHLSVLLSKFTFCFLSYSCYKMAVLTLEST